MSVPAPPPTLPRRREAIATQCLAAIISHRGPWGDVTEDLSKAAVRHADALLKALEE